MKACTNCSKDIPDSAMHCVFCGSKQASKAAPARTMMGYAGMAGDVIAAAKAESEKQAAVAQQPPVAQPAQPLPIDPSADPYGTTQPVDSLNLAYQPPAGAPQPGAPQQAPGAPPQQAYGPPPQQAYGPPPQGQPQPPAGQVAPQMPPYLASETGTRMSSPQEPWAGTLQRVCSGFAIAVGLAFVLPWVIPRGGGHMQFTWDLFDERDTTMQLTPLLILVIAGGAAVAAWVKQMTTATRGAIAMAAGFGPLVFLGSTGFDATRLASGGVPSGFQWRGFAMIVGLGVIVGGCLLRSKYPRALVGRIVATVGAVMVLLAYLVPVDGNVPIVSLFDAMARAPGVSKLLAFYMAVGFVLAALALLAWMPPSTTTGFGAVALGAMLYLPIAIWVAVVVMLADDPGNSVRALGLWYHFPVILLSSFTLGGYGLATVVGKRLEYA